MSAPVRPLERPRTVDRSQPPGHARRKRRRQVGDDGRRIVSRYERNRRLVRWTMGGSSAVLLLGLIVICVGPLLWLTKAAVSTTQDTLRSPLALWPSGPQFGNIAEAWNQAEISHYFMNTVQMAAGSWAAQLIIATTGGYVLSILRPKYARVLTAAVLATLFIPGVVVLVPLFLTVLDLPLFNVSLLDTYWAVWLPHAANAFNVLLVKRFMDGLPRDVFEAARIDGAGPFRMLLAVALPMSRPILGVVSIFAVLNAWKDFLWPKVVLPDPTLQPLSVRLEIVRDTVSLEIFLAAMVISMLLPIAIFLVFQRMFLRNAGLGAAVKG